MCRVDFFRRINELQESYLTFAYQTTMGSISYNFLAESFLFSDTLIDSAFKDVSVDEIEKELESYRNHCLNNFEELKKEISEKKSSIKVFATIDEISISFLTQTALYVEQFIISDPLFKLTEKKTVHSDVMSDYLGFQKSEFDKRKLTKTVAFLKEITPLIASDYVKILPYNIFFESPKELPFKYPKNNYNDILPETLLNFFREKAIVSPMSKMTNGAGWSFTNEKLYPTRAINIRFEELEVSMGALYFLFETQVMNFDEKTGQMNIRQYLPETPPDLEHFNVWVNQSINSTARRIFDQIYLENSIASSLESTFLTKDKFVTQLLNHSFEQKETIQTYTANELINLNLPFISQIDLNKLMDIRTLEEDTFTNFRIELEKNFREIRGLSDPKDIQLKRENIIHELNDVQLSKINSKFSHIKRQLGANSVVLTGSLLASSVTNGFSLLALIHTMASGYKTYNDYIREVKSNPSYLLWKVMKK